MVFLLPLGFLLLQASASFAAVVDSANHGPGGHGPPPPPPPPGQGPGRPTPTKATTTVRASSSAVATPSKVVTREVQQGITGTLVTMPPAATETGLKRIPDAAHPFKAPGPNDLRGPCPAMNTLANHGYIPRNGIASFEQILNALMEAFNLEINFGANMIAVNFFAGGNVFTDQVSIGGNTTLIPPHPNHVFGYVGGISRHGPFEGDASMTREDANIGDHANFNQLLYDGDLLSLGKAGADGPLGNNTVWTVDAIIDMKKRNIAADIRRNPGFEFAGRRVVSAYAEASFIVNILANGTTKQASYDIIGSFFRNQTFPENWFRAAAPVTGAQNGVTAKALFDGVGVKAGRSINGVYKEDPAPPAPFNSSFGCAGYYDQAHNFPIEFQNTTGIFRKNVQFFADILFNAVKSTTCTQQILPWGVGLSPKPRK